MKIKPNSFFAWIFLTSALILHVIDEALNDFLEFYNPLVTSLNENMGAQVFPFFSFSDWLMGLTIGIMILFGLSYFVFKRHIWIMYLAYLYGIVMLLNALGHVLASLYYSKAIAGVYTSPLLLVASVYLIWSSYHDLQSNK